MKTNMHQNTYTHTQKKCTEENYEYSENDELSVAGTNMQGRATKERRQSN